jgi:hypothetical protein
MEITVPNRPNSKNKCPVANIHKVLFIEHIIQSTLTQSISSCPCSNVEKSGQGVVILYLPNYNFILPQPTPQPTQKHKIVSNHPGRLFPTLLIVVYQCPQPLQSSPHFLQYPALPSGTLSKPTKLPIHLEGPVGHPNQPWQSSSTLLVLSFWLVGSFPCGCIA